MQAIMTRARGARTRPLRQRKTLDLAQTLLDEARGALSARTETEAVHVALERVVQNRKFADVIRRLGGRDLVDRRRIDR